MKIAYGLLATTVLMSISGAGMAQARECEAASQPKKCPNSNVTYKACRLKSEPGDGLKSFYRCESNGNVLWDSSTVSSLSYQDECKKSVCSRARSNLEIQWGVPKTGFA